MKKTMLLLSCSILLIGCAKTEQTSSNTTTLQTVTTSESEITIEETSKDSGEVLSAEKNLFTVDVTLPASFFEDTTQEEIEASAKESGINDVKFNEDGSVTYKLSKSKHNELLSSMKTGLDEAITEMLANKETYPSFTEITYNDNCTEFTILCDRSTYSEWDAFAALGFYMQGLYYQVFDGINEEDLRVVVNFVDKDTGEILNTGDSSQMKN